MDKNIIYLKSKISPKIAHDYCQKNENSDILVSSKENEFTIVWNRLTNLMAEVWFKVHDRPMDLIK